MFDFLLFILTPSVILPVMAFAFAISAYILIKMIPPGANSDGTNTPRKRFIIVNLIVLVVAYGLLLISSYFHGSRHSRVEPNHEVLRSIEHRHQEAISRNAIRSVTELDTTVSSRWELERQERKEDTNRLLDWRNRDR